MVFIIAIIVGAFLVYEVVESQMNSTLPDGTSSGSDFIDTLAQSIASNENVDGSANNPGALSAGDVPGGQVIGQFNSAGVVVIDNLQDGWNALLSKLQNIFSGASSVFSTDMTIQQFAGMYTTGNPNDTSDSTNNYAQGIANDLGVSTDTTLADAQSSYDSD
jgi:hypothetical protein